MKLGVDRLLPTFGSPNIVLWCTKLLDISNYNSGEHTAFLILFGWNVWLCECNGSLYGTCLVRPTTILY